MATGSLYKYGHLLKAKKMATWRNGDAKLEAADVQKMDRYIMGRLVKPFGVVTPQGDGANYNPKYETTSYVPGTWEEILYLQTAMNLYPAYGICTTADNTPPGFYTHTFGIRTGESPVNQGRHWSRPNETSAESRNVDIVGMLLNHLHWECSEAVPVGIQKNKWACAYTKSSGTDTITRSEADDEPFKWNHFTFTGPTYNSETLEGTIIGWAHDVINTLYFDGLQSSRYTAGGYLLHTQAITTLEFKPQGSNMFELLDTELEDYLTDVDLTVKMARHATEDYIQFAHDKVYARPGVIISENRSGFYERYILILAQLGTGSIVPTAVDDYDDDYYET